MASIRSIAITKEQAYASLAESTRLLAERTGIEAPALDIHKRYPLEYRQAQELARIAVFLERVVQRLDTEAPEMTGVPVVVKRRPAAKRRGVPKARQEHG